MFMGKYPMKYIAWAALFQDTQIFNFLYNSEDIDEYTIKMAIKGGNKVIIDQIMHDFDISCFMDMLIKHHRNAAVIKLIRQYSLYHNYNHYKNIADQYMNCRMFLVFQ